LKVTRLHTHEHIEYSPKAYSRLIAEEALFITLNNRDFLYDFHRIEDIPFMSSNTLVLSETEKGTRPWFTHCWLMFLLDLVMLGWIQRLKLYYNTYVVHFHLKKWVIQ